MFRVWLKRIVFAALPPMLLLGSSYAMARRTANSLFAPLMRYRDHVEVSFLYGRRIMWVATACKRPDYCCSMSDPRVYLSATGEIVRTDPDHLQSRIADEIRSRTSTEVVANPPLQRTGLAPRR
jgi:hypothetical protein